MKKPFSVRFTDYELYCLDQIQKRRSEYLNNLEYISPCESYSDLIRKAVIRMYNETLEYFMWEKEDLIKINN